MIDIVGILLEQADEIAREGHAGWGNTMLEAAAEIERMRPVVEDTLTYYHMTGGKIEYDQWCKTIDYYEKSKP